MKEYYTLDEMVVKTNRKKSEIYNWMKYHKIQLHHQKKHINFYTKEVYDRVVKNYQTHPGYLNANQLGKKLKIDSYNIYRWIRQGYLIPFTFGTKKLFSPAQMQALKKHQAFLKTHQLFSLADLSKFLKLDLKKLNSVIQKYQIPFHQLKPLNQQHLFEIKDLIPIQNIFENLNPKVDYTQLFKKLKSNQPPRLPKNQRVYIQDLNEKMHLNNNSLYLMAYLNKIENYKDETNNRLYTSKKEAERIQKEYLNYPAEPYFKPLKAAEMLGISRNRLYTLLNAHHEHAHRVFGDKQKYLLQSQIDKIKVWNQQHGTRNKTAKPKALKINTTTRFQKEQHVKANKLAHDLHVSLSVIRQWSLYGKIEYQYNGHDDIYFTKQQADKIQNDYLNYPEDHMLPVSEIARQLNTNDYRVRYLSRKHHIQPAQILGDSHKLFTQNQVEQLKSVN